MVALAAQALRPSVERTSRIPPRRAARRPASVHAEQACPANVPGPCCSRPRKASRARRMAVSSSGDGLPRMWETSKPAASWDSLTPRSPAALQRHVAVLARRQRLPLRLEHLERRDEPGPGLLRLDHVVDVASLRSDERVGEFGLVLADELRLAGHGVGCPFELPPEDDVDRPFG